MKQYAGTLFVIYRTSSFGVWGRKLGNTT